MSCPPSGGVVIGIVARVTRRAADVAPDEAAPRGEARVQLIERVRRTLRAAGYQEAGGEAPGYLLDELAQGRVQLRWGCVGGEAPPESSGWVMLCADLLIAEAFDVEPGGWITGDGETIVIRA